MLQAGEGPGEHMEEWDGPGRHQELPGTPGPGKWEPRLATASSPGQRGRAELLLWAPGRRGRGQVSPRSNPRGLQAWRGMWGT